MRYTTEYRFGWTSCCHRMHAEHDLRPYVSGCIMEASSRCAFLRHTYVHLQDKLTLLPKSRVAAKVCCFAKQNLRDDESEF